MRNLTACPARSPNALKRIFFAWIFAYSILLLLCTSLASAQVSAVLSGTVTDQSGGVVAGATVTAKNIDTGATRSTITDDAGRYQVFALSVIWLWANMPLWISLFESASQASK